MAVRLKSLELSGFKSFAKPARFDFARPITAIVGPNGAGKSNVADSFRWVLGEQSFKSLRGKKGEDLIFNGSPTAARLSKASAVLHFDNSLKQFPLEFEEVAIGRRVYRDGQSEYLLNGSEVRLKDIIELLSNVGLGVSQHHIIGQGEADRILYASTKERQAMIEDALGLKVYQFKRLEAERKLAKTEENMRQAQALQKEIKPHLGHLERLVEKFNKASEIKSELEGVFKEYLARGFKTLKLVRAELKSKKEKPAKELDDSEKKIASLRKKLEEFAKKEENPEALKETEAKLDLLRQKKSVLERETGRLEGIIEAGKNDISGETETVAKDEVEDILAQVDDVLSSAMDTDVIEEIHSIIQDALSRVGAFLGRLGGQKDFKSEIVDLVKKRSGLEKELEVLSEEETALTKKGQELKSFFYEAGREERQVERELMGLESWASGLRDLLRNFDFEEEKAKLRSEELSRDLEESARILGSEFKEDDSAEVLSEDEREKKRKEIDRLKFRLEEAGGVDQDVVKEYEELKERDAFFAKELGDLGQAAKSLRQISKELEEKIKHDFEDGVEKINKEFQKFFETMFGGGKARLAVLKPEKGKKDYEEGSEEDEEAAFAKASAAEGGVDIDVNLPRKKIKGLDMLSGGERVLTSIALLFAMSAVNPPPFLVLDETDAALDESNSRRYADILKDLSRTTQIITITHNRETMKQSGALYGVTIGSDGISRLLSLKFSEAEEIAQ